MDLFAIAQALTRQWWVVALVLFTTAGIAFASVDSFPPTYSIEADYLLSGAAPEDEASGGIVDPAVFAAVLTSRGFGADAEAPFDRMPYTISAVGGAPVVSIQTTDAVRSDAVRGINQLIRAAETVVAELAEADPTTRPTASLEVLSRGAGGIPAPIVAGDEAAGIESLGFIARATVLLRSETTPGTQYTASDYTATVLSERVTAPQLVDEVVAPEGVDEFSFGFDGRASAPIVTITVAGTEPDAVVSAFGTAEALAMRELSDMQAQTTTRGGAETTLEALSRPEELTGVEGNATRPLAIIVLLGILVALGAAVAVDATRQRRDSNRTDDFDTPRPTPPRVTTGAAPRQG